MASRIAVGPQKRQSFPNDPLRKSCGWSAAVFIHVKLSQLETAELPCAGALARDSRRTVPTLPAPSHRASDSPVPARGLAAEGTHRPACAVRAARAVRLVPLRAAIIWNKLQGLQKRWTSDCRRFSNFSRVSSPRFPKKHFVSVSVSFSQLRSYLGAMKTLSLAREETHLGY